MTDFVRRDAFGQSVPHRGMHRTLRAVPRGNPDFDQPPRTRVQWTRAVTFFAQLLKGSPDLRIALLKVFCPLGEFGSHGESPFGLNPAREHPTSFV